jgi:hypothetical protein
MDRLPGNILKVVTLKAGYSLAEVMIALCLFGLMATAFTQTCLYTKRSAESAVCENIALNIAQGYMEQIKTLSYAVLMESINDPTEPIPTLLDHDTEDTLTQNGYVTKTVIIRRDSSGKTVQSLNVKIMASLNDASDGTNRQIIGIKIYFKWIDPVTFSLRERVIRSAKVNI